MKKKCKHCQSTITFSLFSKHVKCEHCGHFNALRLVPNNTNKYNTIAILLASIGGVLYNLSEFHISSTSPGLFYLIIGIVFLALAYFSYYLRSKQSFYVVLIPSSRVLFLKKRRSKFLLTLALLILILSLFMMFGS